MFEIGDTLFYACHGVGTVKAIASNTYLDQTMDVYILEMKNGVEIAIPVDQARFLLTPKVENVCSRCDCLNERT